MHSSLEQYLEFLRTKRRTPATLKVVRHDLTHFIAWWESTWRRAFDPALLRHEDLRDWRMARQRDDGVAPATINRGLASLRGYCRWALAHHLLLENSVSCAAILRAFVAQTDCPLLAMTRSEKGCWLESQ